MLMVLVATLYDIFDDLTHKMKYVSVCKVPPKACSPISLVDDADDGEYFATFNATISSQRMELKQVDTENDRKIFLKKYAKENTVSCENMSDDDVMMKNVAESLFVVLSPDKKSMLSETDGCISVNSKNFDCNVSIGDVSPTSLSSNDCSIANADPVHAPPVFEKHDTPTSLSCYDCSMVEHDYIYEPSESTSATVFKADVDSGFFSSC